MKTRSEQQAGYQNADAPEYMLSELFTIFALVIINGLLSMSEIAIVQAKKSRLEGLAKRGSENASRALLLHQEPTRFLSTVQIGMTLVSILTGLFSGGQLRGNLQNSLLQIPSLAPYAGTISIGIVVLGITFISLVFGELVPKRIGMNQPERIAQMVALPMTWMATATAPFIWMLSGVTNMTIRLMGIKPSEANRVTEEELRAVIDEGTSHGAIESIEGEIMDRVILLGDKRINSLMTSRHDIAWLDIEDPLQQNITLAADMRHSYFPLCEHSLDTVIGVLSVKDMFSMQSAKKEIDLRALAKPPLYFPESMKGYQALERFQAERTHFALVIDEYGTVIGLVTLTDIFDAIVGDIRQEDGESIGYELLERVDGTFLIDGQYPWIDFLQEFEQEDDSYLTNGYHTIAGFIIHELEALPHTSQRVNWRNYIFEVIDMDGPRVDKVLILPNPE